MNKLQISNQVLQTFSLAKIINIPTLGWYVEWELGGKSYSKRWQCRNNSWYPVWSNKAPWGGTSTIALSQLIRWCQNKPVLPVHTWEYWSSDKCKLLNKDTVNILIANRYPLKSNCVLCNAELFKSYDWWHLNKISGPCCTPYEGCKQNV